MDWSKVAKTAGSLGLKVIGGALGGKAGASIGGQVAQWLGLAADASPDQVDEALRTADPEVILGLKRLETEIQKANIEAGVETFRLETKDKQSARDRDTKLRENGYTNKRADLMIAGDVIGLLACLIAMLYLTWLGVNGGSGGEAQPIVMAANGPLGMLTQQFANGLRDAHQFEFGSSRGSKEKDLLAAKSSK